MKEQKPTISQDETPFKGERLNHPAFGNVTVSKITGHANLFMSELAHKNYVEIEICEAELHRDGYSETLFGGRSPIVRIQMSEMQWAHFVSTPNIGSGTACTIKYAPESGTPIKRRPSIDPISRAAYKIDEFGKGALELAALAQSLRGRIDEILEGKSVKKGDLKSLQSDLSLLGSMAPRNAKFAKETFVEFAEQVTESAKADFDGYVLNTVRDLGIKQLQIDAVNLPALLIENQTED